MSSEILNDHSGLSDGDRELVDFVAAELANRNRQLKQQKAKQIVDMIHGGQPVAAHYGAPIMSTAPVPEVFRLGGSDDEIDLSSLSPEARSEYIRTFRIQKDDIQEVEGPRAYQSYPPGFSSFSNGPSVAEKQRKIKRPTRKQAIYAGGAALALTLTGGAGVMTNGFGTGITIPGLQQDQPNAEAAIADTEKITDPAPVETAAPPAPEAVVLNASHIVLGDCLDDNGQGKALASATVSFGANQNYKFKTLTGEEVLLMNGKEKPRIELPESKANVAACIPSEARKDAIVVDGNKVTVNWDKIDRQLGVSPGAGEKSPTVEEWDMDAEPGVTDLATVAALEAAMTDPANHNAAINIARAEFGNKLIAESEPAIQAKLTEALKAEITAQVTALQAAKKAPAGEVSVAFTGTPKPLGYKGPAAETVAAFEVVDTAVKDNDNNPETPLLAVEFK